jgi:prepilin peptidase CpaA
VLEQSMLLVFPFAMAIAGVADLTTFRIPNPVVTTLLAGFLVSAALGRISLAVMISHIVVSLIVLLVGFFMFARGWIGGGDAKLMAAAALWIGFDHLLPFIFWITLLGGALSIVLLTYRRFLPPLWLVGQSWAMRLHDRKEGIPYGVAIAGAGLIVYPSTGWMTGFAG